MDESKPPSGWRRAVDSAWEAVPEIVVSTLVALVGFGIWLWIDSRDHTHQIGQLESSSVEQSKRLDSLADCVRRPECEAMRAVVHALELRITALEAKVVAHETTARELNGDWRSRLLDLERQIQRLATDATTKPDDFTGRDGRELEDRIRKLETK